MAPLAPPAGRWPERQLAPEDTLGGMIARYRQAAGLSQNALARLAGVNAGYVNRIERGMDKGKKPSREVVAMLAYQLGLDDRERDRLLFVAGHAPVIDWQARAERSEELVDQLMRRR